VKPQRSRGLDAGLSVAVLRRGGCPASYSTLSREAPVIQSRAARTIGRRLTSIFAGQSPPQSLAVEGRLPRGINIERLRDAPME
jgi:hypothetical protein